MSFLCSCVSVQHWTAQCFSPNLGRCIFAIRYRLVNIGWSTRVLCVQSTSLLQVGYYS